MSNPVSRALSSANSAIDSAIGAASKKPRATRPGSFAGIAFDVVDTRGLSLGLRVQDDELPFSSQVPAQIIGARKPMYSVEAILAGPDYATRLDDLIAAINLATPLRYIDPWRGEIGAALIRSCQIHEDRALGRCELSLEISDEREIEAAESTSGSAAARRQSLLTEAIAAVTQITDETTSTIALAGQSVRTVTAAALRIAGAVRDTLRAIEGAVLSLEDAAYEAYAAALEIRDMYADFGRETADNFSKSRFSRDSAAESFSELSEALDIPAPIEAYLTASLLFGVDVTTTADDSAAIRARNNAIIDRYFASLTAALAAKALADTDLRSYSYATAISLRDRLCAALVRCDQGALAASVYDLISAEAASLSATISYRVSDSASALELAQIIYGDPERMIELMQANDIFDACMIQHRTLTVASA